MIIYRRLGLAVDLRREFREIKELWEEQR